MGLTAAAASLEVQPASSLWQQLGNLGLPLPHLHGRPHFTDASSADDQLHAVLAKRVYLDPSERKGLRVASMQVKSVLALGDFWVRLCGWGSSPWLLVLPCSWWAPDPGRTWHANSRCSGPGARRLYCLRKQHRLEEPRGGFPGPVAREVFQSQQRPNHSYRSFFRWSCSCRPGQMSRSSA